MADMPHDPRSHLQLSAEAAAAVPRRPAARREHDVQDDMPYHAVARMAPERVAKALKHAAACAQIADDNRAKDILLLDLRGATPLLDFFVIATAATRRQAHSIAFEIDAEMKKVHEGRWILIDYGDFVVHVFTPESRSYYALEEIWGDAPRLDWRDPNRPAPQAGE
jgi:ribosome-associated protein